jgi:hypothetical protein
MDPCFIEANEWLGKVKRFDIKRSPKLLALGVGDRKHRGLFATRTLLQGVRYDSLIYFGRYLTATDVKQSTSSYIWQFGDREFIDAKPATTCLGRFINSCEKIGGDCDETEMNVVMLKDLKQYVPQRNIAAGEELITKYGQEYWGF